MRKMWRSIEDKDEQKEAIEKVVKDYKKTLESKSKKAIGKPAPVKENKSTKPKDLNDVWAGIKSKLL